ncbi:MAG: DUF2207 domain-containing protein [Candidatus Colwellbacteria bacterium]|nr:DUF2207 domain-containing protein [Candidatus Colwellbacteria bacterium]
MKKIILSLVLGAAFLFPAAAEARSYRYESIDIDYTVNSDSTVDVIESQIFKYDGEYNKGWRDILLKGIDAVTDVSVIDGETGKELERSFFDLEKTDPRSWGKYFISQDGDSVSVSWYYDLKDTVHKWIVRYKLHGAISFLKEKDELYWNAIGDQYDVPIMSSVITVRIPDGASVGELSSAVYYEPGGVSQAGSKRIIDARTFEFSATDIPPETFVTIAAGWPKGLVSQAGYWADFILIHWQWPAAVLLFIFFTIWFKAWLKKREAARGVIIPEYEPPENIRPAMVDVLVNGSIGGSTWSATIVDLAVRGYLTIEEKRKELGGIVQAFAVVGMVLVIFFIGVSFVENIGKYGWAGGTAIIFGLIFIVILFFVAKATRKRGSYISEYIIRKKDDSKDGLEEYEVALMDILFSEGDVFSTKVNFLRRESLAKKISEIGKKLRAETEGDTGAFEKGLFSFNRKRANPAREIATIFALLAVATIALLIAVRNFSSNPFWVVAASCAIYFLFFLIFGRKLSPKGKILNERWLGFKMYLETAEKYRLQNLTPELFERYLPYAMIFGLEKKWARAFEGITVPQPSWYSSSSPAGIAGGVSFSPSSFGSGFSSSFSSIFSSATGSSGGGGSGGGGSSGGGGGGGGGGAS